MAKGVRKCKVCGREYEYCHTIRAASNVFRYQDVACCPEHGAIYLAQVLESRRANNTTKDEDKNVKPEENVQESILDISVEEQVQDVATIAKEPLIDETLTTYDVNDVFEPDESEEEKEVYVDEAATTTKRQKRLNKKSRAEVEETFETEIIE